MFVVLKSPLKHNQTVIYLWPYLDWGGAQIYFFSLIKSVRATRNVKVVAPAASAPRLFEYLRQLGVDFEPLAVQMGGSAQGWSGRFRRRWQKIRCEWVIARQLSRYDRRRTILHLDIGPWSSFWLLFYLSLRGRVFVTLHTALPAVSTLRFASWWVKFQILGRLGGFHLLTSNRDTLESLRPYLPKEIMRRVPVAYSGVDVSEIQQALAAPFDRDSLCRRFQLDPESVLIFALGQFIERKGCRILLEAARELLTEYPQLHFVWIGTDPLDKTQRRQIQDSGVAARFRYISGEELGGGRLNLLTTLRLADLFVLPSLQEGLPLALIEAMALGKPCIASNINAIPEALINDQTGLLVPAADSGALAEGIAEMLRDETQRQRLARAGQSAILAQFDERVSAAVTMEYYGDYDLGPKGSVGHELA